MYSFSSLHPLPSDGAKDVTSSGSKTLGHSGPWRIIKVPDSDDYLLHGLGISQYHPISIAFFRLGFETCWKVNLWLVWAWFPNSNVAYEIQTTILSIHFQKYLLLRKSHDYCKKEAFLFGVQQHHVSWQGFVADLRISIDPEFLWRVGNLTLSPNLGISCEILFITKTREEFGFKKDCVAQLLRNNLCHQTGMYYTVNYIPFSPRLPTLKQMEHLVANGFVKNPQILGIYHRSEKGIRHKIRKGFLQNKGNCSPRPMNILPSMVMAIFKWRMLRQQAGREQKLESQNRVQNHPSDLPIF